MWTAVEAIRSAYSWRCGGEWVWGRIYEQDVTDVLTDIS